MNKIELPMLSLQRISLLYHFLFLPYFVFAQSLEQAVVNDYQSYVVNERVLLETDRQIYMAGESINVSCNLIEPYLQRPLNLSKVIYIEFYSDKNLIIEQVKIGCTDWHGQGTIPIPKSLPGGQYYIRAYTNYMKNFGARSFSYNSIIVLNPFEQVSNELADDSVSHKLANIQIYPEGGNLIYGYMNNLVCLVTGNSGEPIASCEGKLMDDNGVFHHFRTNRYGVGHLSFLPQKGVKYYLEAISNNNLIRVHLPIKDSTVTLVKTNQDQSNFYFKLLLQNYDAWPLELYVVQLNTSVFLRNLSLSDSIFVLPAKCLPKGIVQIQVQDAHKKVVSHRSVFNSPISPGEIKIHTKNKTYQNREKIELTLQNLGSDSVPLSLSVYLVNSESIPEYLHLDSVKHIKQALYSFLNSNKYPVSEIVSDKNFLDNMLLTGEPLNSKLGVPKNGISTLKYIPEYNTDLIMGNMINAGGNPVPLAPVLLAWQDTISDIQVTRTDAQGKFIMESKKIGYNSLFVSAGKNTNNHIDLQEEFFTDFIPIAKEEYHINKKMGPVLLQQLLNLQINDAFLQHAERRGNTHPVPFYFKPDITYFINDYVLLPSFGEFLFEIVPEVMIIKEKGKTLIRMHFPLSNLPFGEDPLFLVDGVPVFDPEIISKLRCADLLSVDIVKDKFFFKNVSFDGILDIHTRTGDASIINSVNFLLLPFIGLQEKEMDETFNIPQSRTTDPFFRTELHWEGYLSVASEKPSVIQFVSPDNQGVYLVKCASVNSDGSISYCYTTFEVGSKSYNNQKE